MPWVASGKLKDNYPCAVQVPDKSNSARCKFDGAEMNPKIEGVQLMKHQITMKHLTAAIQSQPNIFTFLVNSKNISFREQRATFIHNANCTRRRFLSEQ